MSAFLKWILSIIEGNISKIFDIAEPIITEVLEDDTIPLNQKFAVVQTRVLAVMEKQAIPIVIHEVNTAIVSAIGKQQVDIITPAIQIGGNPSGGGPAALHAHGG